MLLLLSMPDMEAMLFAWRLGIVSIREKQRHAMTRLVHFGRDGERRVGATAERSG
jgi:hypothetical protein